MPYITIYSTSTCPYCLQLKNYLTEKGKNFTEKFIDTDESARVEMEKITGGFLGVPFVSISVGDQIEKIIGFDKGRLEAVLK